MPISEPEPVGTVIPGTGNRPVRAEARAYCGPAHGQQWTVTDEEPPAWVELPWGSATALYRLVRQPHSRRPARDHLGNYLYVPLSGGHAPPADDDGARILAFPRGGGVPSRGPEGD